MSEWGPQDDDPGKPGVGRHRAPATTGQQLLRRLIAPLIAVAMVAAVIGVLIALRGHSSGNGPGPGVVTAPTITPIGSPSRSRSASPSMTPTVTITQTHPPPTPSLRPTRRAHRPAWKTAMAAVRVYNTTHISQLAHHIAAEIAAKGWTVPDVGNMSGVSSSTTLYYSPGSHAAAVHLAHEFSGIRRVRPNSEAALDFHGLTLLITADWHD
ncbi:MAG TPA: LytR C-terminal domain-containing protein [Mycobacteriales bacterium]|nr:LytR C-terminal domain-containing protein [Mycobacteriales bacterium]HVY08786.1 LytR C-terminal domain-containing protein [Mycobacteriales bacterium]